MKLTIIKVFRINERLNKYVYPKKSSERRFTACSLLCGRAFYDGFFGLWLYGSSLSMVFPVASEQLGHDFCRLHRRYVIAQFVGYLGITFQHGFEQNTLRPVGDVLLCRYLYSVLAMLYTLNLSANSSLTTSFPAMRLTKEM